jgi:hypothetical protein
MKKRWWILGTLLIMGLVRHAGAVEEAAYTQVARDGRFEVRDYAPMVVAETVVEGDRVSAGDRAFRPLFRYISADNRDGAEIPMTAPVTQTASGDQWAVAFVMPAASALDRLPAPGEPAVTLREIPARRMAVVRYSGFWSEKRYTEHETRLRDWMAKQGLEPAGEAVWARYNPPFTPWFLRRNEVLIPVR